MEGSDRPFFLWIFLSLSINIALAVLSVIPSDTVSVVGKDTHFDCASTIKDQSIHWFHYPIGSLERKLVHGFNRSHVPYVGRFDVEKLNTLTGAYRLRITNVAEGDAGDYECQDDGGHGNKSKAQLTVLHSEPLCSSNMTSGEVIIGNNNCGFTPEVVQFSCSVKFTGKSHPTLEWISVGQNVPLTDGVTSTTTGDNVTTTLTLKGVSSANGQSFTCRAPKTTSTSAEFFSCPSGVVGVWHATNNFLLTQKPLNESVSCEEENSLQKSLCSYKWTKSDSKGEVVVSTKSTMRPVSSGIYRCTIDCTVKGQKCSINRMMVNVVDPTSAPQTDAQTSEAPYKSAFIIVLILLIIFIILTAGLGAFVFIHRKRKRHYKSENSLMKVKEDDMQKLQTELEEERKKYKELKSKDAMEGPGFDGILAKAQAQWAREKDVLLKRLEDLKKGPVGVEYSAKPKLIGTIMTTASKSDNKSIKGVALFNNELYIISQKESEVEVYDSTSLQHCRTWKLDELTCPEDACACTKNRCLYISENKQHVKEILRIDPNGKLINKWQIGNEFCRLSVSSEATVVAVVHDNSKLMEYSADGNHIRTHDLSLLNIQHPMHALKLKSKNYLIIHGYLQDKIHRLCEMDVGSNKIAKSFGGEKGGGDAQLSNPTCMAIDREGSVMVADATNGRIVLLGSNFEFKREVVTKEDGISIPTRILLDEMNKRLYVGDYKSKSRVLYAFEIE